MTDTKKLYLLNPVQLNSHNSFYKEEIKNGYNFDLKEQHFRKEFQENKNDIYVETLARSAKQLGYNELATELRDKDSNIFKTINQPGASISTALSTYFKNRGQKNAQELAEHIWAVNCLKLNLEQKVNGLPNLQDATIIVPAPKMAKFSDIIETLCSELKILPEIGIERSVMSEEEIRVSLTEDHEYAQKHGIKETRFKFSNVENKPLEEVINMDIEAEQKIQEAYNTVLKNSNKSLTQLTKDLEREQVTTIGK